MRKIVLLILTVSMIFLVSCDLLEHKHTESGWKCTETEHWRVPVCDRENCVLEQEVYDLGNHIDDNIDCVCDICGYKIEHKHIEGEWAYDEEYHWRSSIDCTWSICSIDPALIAHADENGDKTCDACGYEMISELKAISSITDNSYEFGIPVGDEIFYSDRYGFYMFVGKFSEYVIVSYIDGTSENVRDALRNGHIQISDLDKYGIEYYVQSMSQMASSIARFILTLDDLSAIVERYGESLTWSHFDRYYSWEVGSGLYIRYYPIDENYSLRVGGGGVTSPPDYIYLVDENSDNRIDVRYESIDEFLNANSN